jgi:hypothetical protein
VDVVHAIEVLLGTLGLLETAHFGSEGLRLCAGICVLH